MLKSTSMIASNSSLISIATFNSLVNQTLYSRGVASSIGDDKRPLLAAGGALAARVKQVTINQ